VRGEGDSGFVDRRSWCPSIPATYRPAEVEGVFIFRRKVTTYVIWQHGGRKTYYTKENG